MTNACQHKVSIKSKSDASRVLVHCSAYECFLALRLLDVLNGASDRRVDQLVIVVDGARPVVHKLEHSMEVVAKDLSMHISVQRGVSGLAR
jgi:hypothetical protein